MLYQLSFLFDTKFIMRMTMYVHNVHYYLIATPPNECAYAII